MIFEKIFYIISIFTFLIYSIRLFVKYGKNIRLLNILTQTISLTILCLAYINDNQLNLFMQSFVFIFGILLPVVYILIKYFDINIKETYYLLIGDINFLLKKYDLAKKDYQYAIDSYNESYKGYKRLGFTYLKLNDLRNAFDAFASSVEIKKDDYKIYYQLGYIYEELNKKKEAITVLNSGLRIKPDYLPISNLLAIILCEQENYEDALRVYEDALKYRDDNYEIYYNMAVIYTNLGKYIKAQECYKKAIKLNSQLHDAYLGLGQLYLIDKNLDEAEKYLFRATNSEALYAKAYYSLAKLYSLKCEEGKIVSCLKLAIDKDSSYAEKAINEPIFSNIKDFIIGLNMLNEMTNGTSTKLEIDESTEEEFLNQDIANKKENS